MTTNLNNDLFQSKLRILIVAALISGEKSFVNLKNITGATDGNLSVQLNKLKDVNYITEKKQLDKKKIYTIYSITQLGYYEFKNYVDFLQNILDTSITPE